MAAAAATAPAPAALDARGAWCARPGRRSGGGRLLLRGVRADGEGPRRLPRRRRQRRDGGEGLVLPREEAWVQFNGSTPRLMILSITTLVDIAAESQKNLLLDEKRVGQ